MSGIEPGTAGSESKYANPLYTAEPHFECNARYKIGLKANQNHRNLLKRPLKHVLDFKAICRLAFIHHYKNYAIVTRSNKSFSITSFFGPGFLFNI